MRYYFFLFCILSTSSSMAMGPEEPSHSSLLPLSSASSSLDFPQLSNDTDGLAPHANFTSDNAKCTIRGGEETENNKRSRTRESFETSNQPATLPAMPQSSLSQSSSSSSSNSPMIPQEEIDFESLKQAAKKKRNTEAQVRLAEMYISGQVPSGETNDEKALKWLTRAASRKKAKAENKLEYAKAQSMLGEMYMHGRVSGGKCSENDVEAVKWLRKAAKNGNVHAKINLARMYSECRSVEGQLPGNCDKVANLLRQAVDGGLPETLYQKTLYQLGWVYATGQGPGGKSPENNMIAIRWYELAAEVGNVPAQVNLGVMYATGQVPGKTPSECDEEAFKWFREAAEAGNLTAQYNLGVLYMTTQAIKDGIPLKSTSLAIKCLKEAGNKGHQGAKDKLNAMLGPQPGSSSNL